MDLIAGTPEQIIAAIKGQLDKLPPVLSTDERATFVLGYYHQIQAMSSKNGKNSSAPAPAATKTNTSQDEDEEINS
jgi:hypothetical protein